MYNSLVQVFCLSFHIHRWFIELLINKHKIGYEKKNVHKQEGKKTCVQTSGFGKSPKGERKKGVGPGR